MVETLRGVGFYRIVPYEAPWNQSPFITYNLAALVKSAGVANCVRVNVKGKSQYGYFDASYPEGTASTKTIFQMCRTAGLRTLLSCTDNLDNTEAGLAQAILNQNGEGDSWRTLFGQIIRDVQPDAVEIMNEPPALTDYGGTWQNYRDFCISCISAWRLINPSLPIYVQNAPFWDFKNRDGTGTFATNPLPFTGIVYTFHLYYDSTTANRYPWGISYQNGDFATAKAQLETYLLDPVNNLGLQPLISAGLQVANTEEGAEPTLPNYKQFLLDMYDFVKRFNMGLIQWALEPSPPNVIGILTPDWLDFNETGFLWKTQAPPPPENQYYTLTVMVNPADAGTISVFPDQPVAGYLAGTQVQITATAAEGLKFINFSVNGAAPTTTNPLVVTMNTNLGVIAFFSASTPTNATLAARIPSIGNKAIVQVYLRKLRDKVFSKKIHKLLHPLI